MKRNYNLLKTLFLPIAIMVITGCANNPTTSVDAGGGEKVVIGGAGGELWDDGYPSNTSEQIVGSTTPYAPACVEYKGLFYMFFKANTHSTILYRTAGDLPGLKSRWNSMQTGLTWSKEFSTPATSTYEPAVTIFGDKLYVFYKGATNNNMYYVTFDGTTWSNWVQVKNKFNEDLTTSLAPSVCTMYDRSGAKYIRLFWKGRNNNNIYWTIMDPNGTWSFFSQMPAGDVTNMRPSASCNIAPNGVDYYTIVAWKDANGTNIKYRMELSFTNTWGSQGTIADVNTNQGPCLVSANANPLIPNPYFSITIKQQSDGQIYYGSIWFNTYRCEVTWLGRVNGSPKTEMVPINYTGQYGTYLVHRGYGTDRNIYVKLF